MKSPGLAILIAMAVILSWTNLASAAVCNVPSAPHPTIQAAVDDISCTEVAVAAGSFSESVEIDRTLTVNGASSSTTVIDGRLVVIGTSVELALNSLKVDASGPSVAGCYAEAVEVSGGAALTSNDLVAVNADGDACLLFGDGFESGDTGAWSNTTP